MKDLLEFVENHYRSLYFLVILTIGLNVRILPKGDDKNEH